MSFFPRSYFASPESSFTPLFRLLDDFDEYKSSSQGDRQSQGRRSHPSFTPRFDVKETENGYELHGELPGIEKSNVHIEFTEPQTIVISGRTERHTTTSGPAIEGTKVSGAITESGEGNNSHRASVSDEEAEKAKEKGTPTSTAVATKKSHKAAAGEKFWVSERSVGEFHRAFSFPTPVDQDGVAANLQNGILSVTVPKAKKQEGRRIAIN